MGYNIKKYFRGIEYEGFESIRRDKPTDSLKKREVLMD
jgi:hypothetical protein